MAEAFLIGTGGAGADLSSVTLSANGTYYASASGVDGFDVVTVDVSGITFTETEKYFNKILESFSDNTVTTAKNLYFGSNSIISYISLGGISIFDSTITNSKFYGCSRLCEIHMPNITTAQYLTENIGRVMFPYCFNLSIIDIGALKSYIYYSTTGIQEYSNSDASIYCSSSIFANCYALRSVDMPNVSILGSSVFYNCFIGSISLPALTSVSGTFGYVPYLHNLYLPELSNGTATLASTLYIHSVVVPKSSTNINTSTNQNINCLNYISASIITLNNGAKPRHIITSKLILQSSSTITNLVQFRFTGNTDFNVQFGSQYSPTCPIRMVVFDDITGITNSNAFRWCTQLAKVVILTSSVPSLISTFCFANMPNYASIYVLSSLVEDYKIATNWITYSSKITSVEEDTLDEFTY